VRNWNWKRILKFVAVMSLVVAVLSTLAGSMAIFADTETSQDNYFEAGTLNLTVDGRDDPNVMHFTLTNIKPCDGVGGAEHSLIKYQWVLGNTGSLSGQPWIEIKNCVNYENGRNEPELAVDGTGGNPGPGNGELGQYLLLQINAAGSGGFMYPHGGPCVDGGRNCPLNYWCGYGPIGQTGGQQWEVIGPSSSIAALVLEFELPCAVGNVVQSDSVEFDIVFHLDQAP